VLRKRAISWAAWFAAYHGHGHALDDAELLVQEGIFITKQERHGVPFGLYTNGLVTPRIPLSELGLYILQVSQFVLWIAAGICASDGGEMPKPLGNYVGSIVDDAVEQSVTVEVL
jgi:hypothetical protein